MKLIIDNNKTIEDQFKTLFSKVEQVKNNIEQNKTKLEKDIGRRDEAMRQELNAIERMNKETLDKRCNDL